MNQYNVVYYNRETAPLIQADKKVYFEKIELEDATCFFPSNYKVSLVCLSQILLPGLRPTLSYHWQCKSVSERDLMTIKPFNFKSYFDVRARLFNI